MLIGLAFVGLGVVIIREGWLECKLTESARSNYFLVGGFALAGGAITLILSLIGLLR